MFFSQYKDGVESIFHVLKFRIYFDNRPFDYSFDFIPTVDLICLNPYCSSNDLSVVWKTFFVLTFIIFLRRFPTVLNVKSHTNPIIPGGCSLF